jgi:hypothetical protein
LPFGVTNCPRHACQLAGVEVEGFADSVQKAAGNLFPAIHMFLAPSFIERGCGPSAAAG